MWSLGSHGLAVRPVCGVDTIHTEFTQLLPLLDYEVKSLLDDANVLRDSILIQLETVHFEAYCHMCALVWRVIFMELRGLTNSKGLEIDPMTLNALYENLYDVGLVMQTEKALVLLEPYVRPWPHLYQTKNAVRNSIHTWNTTWRRTWAYYGRIKHVMMYKHTSACSGQSLDFWDKELYHR